MDDFDQPWPYWKFHLQRGDISKLADRYNTFQFSLQDPEAFYHDVLELSHEASTTEEFHVLLADRKQQRIRELDESLESASLEIIANPGLIGTEQWQHAVQLFRTRSLDSLVRYFASYLPQGHPWHKSDDSTSSSSDLDSIDTCITQPHEYFFDGPEEDSVLVAEPLSLSTSDHHTHLPLSPRSMTMCSDDSAGDTHPVCAHKCTAPYTSFISGIESALHDPNSDLHDDSPRPRDFGSPITSVSDTSEPGSFQLLSKEVRTIEIGVRPRDDREELAEPDQVPESLACGLACETPTPKPGPPAASFLHDAQSSLLQQRYRSRSPSRPHSLLHTHPPTPHPHRDLQIPGRPRGHCKAGWKPLPHRRRRKNGKLGGEQTIRVRKPLPAPTRNRPRGKGQRGVVC